MSPVELLDILTRAGVVAVLAILIFLLLTERLIPRGRLDEMRKELDEERRSHAEDRTAFRAAVDALTGKMRNDG